MNSAKDHPLFSGSVAELYEQHMVPLIFYPFANDLVRRLALLQPKSVLEVAAGTGVVTRLMASQLPADVSIVATDLNLPMITHALGIGTSRPVTWRQADAMSLPFADETFDVVVCQFGAMFFPDKATAFAEARRVLRPGGTFLFSVWDKIETNEFAECVTRALAGLFPTNPPDFLGRLPHGYYKQETIAQDLVRGGFTNPLRFETVVKQSAAKSPEAAAFAYCQGTPLRNEIEARDAAILGKATALAATALGERFGKGEVTGKIQAWVISATRTAEVTMIR
jgi:SAM-dependent methyltransferase